MFGFGVGNLRRLQNVPPIELRPITLLVGRNSSGKSTYLRSFPLLRQSVATRTSAPILWYGDLVDFGNFLTSVRDNDLTNCITFSFQIDRVSVPKSLRIAHQSEFFISNFFGIKCFIEIVPQHARTRISQVTIEIDEPRLKFSVKVNEQGIVSNLEVNNRPFVSDTPLPVLKVSMGSIFPEIHPDRTTEEVGGFSSYYRRAAADLLYEQITNYLRPLITQKIQNESLELASIALAQLGPIDDIALRQRLEGIGPKTFLSFMQEVFTTDKKKIKPRLKELMAVAIFPVIFNRMNSEIRNAVLNTLYIGPARARSERYYRYQDLSVSEIDPDGKNFPMFLNSLRNAQIKRLSNWIESLYGYGIDVNRSEAGHISINLTEGESSTNVIDVGYGVSQILPVLAQIWWARERPQVNSVQQRAAAILAIEQPELHLHPAHQALLADAMVGQTLKGDIKSGSVRQVSFLVETHSETMINRLGELIADGKIDANDVQIMIFETDQENRLTEVKKASFSAEGTLANWPYGFFQAEI